MKNQHTNIFKRYTTKLHNRLSMKWLVVFFLAIGIPLFVTVINLYMKISTNNNIICSDNYVRLQADCILILGAGVWSDKPSPMLSDRLMKGIDLYKSNVSDKIIVTGDHGKKEYDEVSVMKKFLVNRGIPSENIFMDHAGFSTYESIYRAKKIFKVNKIVIVTQKYHLYRSLYIAKKLGLDAYGVSSDIPREYAGQSYREFREILARNKDFLTCVFKTKPTYLGDIIPITGDGNITNDR